MQIRAKTALRSWDIVIAIVALIAVLAAGCTNGAEDDPAPESSTTSTVVDAAASGDEPLVFGDGVVPETAPADFPLPEQAVVGTTMIDRTRGVTEYIVVYPANVLEVVAYYEANLPALSYDITASSGTDAKWSIEFAKGDTTGEVSLSVGGQGLTQGAVTFVDSSVG